MAKTMTISVPEDLFKALKKFPAIKVSATCQTALQKKLEDLKAYKLADEDLLGHAEMRLMKELGKEWDEYEKDCYKAGEEWAAREASLEQLEELFEKQGNSIPEIFNGLAVVPQHIFDRDHEGDNDLYFSFQDGARDMWEKIKERLESKGYEF
jgi:post-segregation antitoxin (ccd killing protein)